MSKKEEKLEFYKREILNYTHSVDYPLLEEIVESLGLTIFRADAELVSSSDKKELETVKKNFLKKKLGLKDLSNIKLNEGIENVIDIFGSSNTKKYRALFYYFLTKEFHKEDVFLKWSVDDEEHLDKIEKLVNTKKNKLKRKNKKNNNLYLALVLNVLLIIFLIFILF